MSYDFNGSTKLITLSGVTVLSLPDLYSRYKDWVLTGSNAGFMPAFRTVGGDIPSIPLYLFLINGWRIVPMASDHTLAVTSGTLEVDGGGDPFVDPVGAFKIRINRETPGIAFGYSTSGGGASAAEVASAVWAHQSAVTLTDRMQIASAILRNKTVTNPTTGVMTVYADDGVTPLLTATLHEDVAQTQQYRGRGAEVRGRLQ